MSLWDQFLNLARPLLGHPSRLDGTPTSPSVYSEGLPATPAPPPAAFPTLASAGSPDFPRRPQTDYPSTYRPFPAADAVGRPQVFDPALQHFPRGFRLGDPTFASPELAARWHAARRQAMDHVLRVVATSPWRDQLVLRGSLLLKAWLGIPAREPGDMDWVVTPQGETAGGPWAARLFAELPKAVLGRPCEGDVRFVAADVAADEIWMYDRAPGRRIVFPWRADGLPRGTVQLDFVFNEVLPVPPEKLNVRIDDDQIEWIWSATKDLSLAWKILWLETDMHPQGKDLYDATLLAEQTRLSPALLRTVLSTSPELATVPELTAELPMRWHVDWENFQKEYPWVDGAVEDWKLRLTNALRPTLGSAAGPASEPN